MRARIRRDRGRGANWVLSVTFPRPYGGQEITYSKDGQTATITIPFARKESAELARGQMVVEVRPGENHVIQGTTIGPDEMAELETAAGFTQDADERISAGEITMPFAQYAAQAHAGAEMLAAAHAKLPPHKHVDDVEVPVTLELDNAGQPKQAATGPDWEWPAGEDKDLPGG